MVSGLAQLKRRKLQQSIYLVDGLPNGATVR
jgi:hypothetical protein